ncbi:MAG: hydroxymethylglutaryl-CoA lyase [Deltaproteobacteria bacterium]|jgi:hydroxymethylglutaryl-CoA lyase|nr:hydroxymethylglutaryl-CoA lyase [Deltaproteobacteria bacterium]
MACCAAAYPKSVQVVDITGRDGFQNVKDWIPTELKKTILDQLAAAGVSKVEATSFVSPKAIPQMADAAEIIAHMKEKHPDIALVALTPNLKGVQRAAECGVTEVSYIISASVAHNRANVNRTHQESLDDLAAIVDACPGVSVNLSMPTVFGCPFEGEVPIARVIDLLGECKKRGAKTASLCDTIGVANPVQIREVVTEVQKAFPELDFALHLHDTHGMGLANTFAALQCGVARFETAAGGLGGCPFAPGAAGNTSTEDMLNMLHRMGIATGINLEKYLTAVATVRDAVSPKIPGRLIAARTYAEFCFHTPLSA